MVFGIKLTSLPGNGYTSGGSSIEGSVYFDISKEVSADDLVAVLLGEERCSLAYTRTEEDERKPHHATAKRNLIHLTIPINAGGMIQNGKVLPGNYVVPFSIQLPAGLPSTMKIVDHDSSCEVRYSLKAQLKGSGWVQDYKYTQPLLVQGAPLPADPVPYQGPPIESVVNMCCCWNKGSLLFGAHVTDTLLDRGQSNIAITLACRNRSTVDIKSIQAKLIQRISWSAEGHKKDQTITLNTFDFGTAMQGLNKTSPAERGFHDNGMDLKEIARELEEAKYSGTVQLPYSAIDTFPGQLIQTKHYITVVVDTGSCTTAPTIAIPVQVGPPRPGGSNTAPPPAASAPTEPEINFNFESATTAETVVVSGTGAHFGGAPHAADDDEVEPSIAFAPRVVSVENLLKDLNESVKDYDFISNRIHEGGEWKAIIASLSPTNYGKLIKEVDLDFDQPKVAEIVAQEIGDNFTCHHVAVAIGKCSDWNKATVVKKLLPLTKDLAQNKAEILGELSDWDKTVTDSAFKNALSESRNSPIRV
jgi:hypothetical protein